MASDTSHDISTTGIVASLAYFLSDIPAGVGRALTSKPARKARAYSHAWLVGFAQGVWFCDEGLKGTTFSDSAARFLKHRLKSGWQAAGERVCDISYALNLVRLNQEVLFIPAEEDWTLVRSSDDTLRQLENSDAEFADVASQLFATLPLARVVSICRVQQQDLREDFERARDLLGQRVRRRARRAADGGDDIDCGQAHDDAHVLHLWHGSGRNDPRELIADEYPFDFRLSRNGLWGRAAYFACDARYSNDYAHVLGTSRASNGTSLRQLFLAEVAVGVAERRSQGSIGRPSPGFDSVTGWAGSSQVYMLYDLQRAFPTYLVTYEIDER